MTRRVFCRPLSSTRIPSSCGCSSCSMACHPSPSVSLCRRSSAGVSCSFWGLVYVLLFVWYEFDFFLYIYISCFFLFLFFHFSFHSIFFLFSLFSFVLFSFFLFFFFSVSSSFLSSNLTLPFLLFPLFLTYPPLSLFLPHSPSLSLPQPRSPQPWASCCGWYPTSCLVS